MFVSDVRAGMSMYSVQSVGGYEMACCSDKRDGLRPAVSTDSRSCDKVYGFPSGWLGFGVSACRPFNEKLDGLFLKFGPAECAVLQLNHFGQKSFW